MKDLYLYNLLLVFWFGFGARWAIDRYRQWKRAQVWDDILRDATRTEDPSRYIAEAVFDRVKKAAPYGDLPDLP